ncbi:MAG: ATP-binding protein [Firmicutes bacterium]|nr:ATP-binding protein [Bacillota bacterium]
MGLRRARRALVDSLDPLWPSHLLIHPSYVEIGEHVIRFYQVSGYPREVGPGWLDPLLQWSWPLTIVMHVEPVDTGTMVRSMTRRMVWHRGALAWEQNQGRLSRADRLVALDDAERLRLTLVRGDARMLEVSMIVGVWGRTVDDLNRQGEQLESRAQSLLLLMRVLTYRQLEALKQLVPVMPSLLPRREMDSRAWATIFPFSSDEIMHDGGQVFGVNPRTKALIVVDRFQLASPHSITIGWSGAGKSFAAKLEALRAQYRPLAVSIVDPEGEYCWLRALGAQVWNIGTETGAVSRFPYDPFTVDIHASEEEISRQADFLMRLLRRLAPDFVDALAGDAENALWRAIRQASGRWTLDGGAPVTMADWLRALPANHDRVRNRLETLWQRWRGVVGPSQPLDATFEVFDFSGVVEGMKGAVYLALTEWLMRRMERDARRRLIIFDEAWHLLTDDESASYLEELFRRGRKWGTAVSLLTQDISDFTRSRAAEVCLRNAPMLLLLRQHPESLREVQTLLRLSDAELDVVRQASQGDGLLLLADQRVPIRIVASRREQTLLTGTEE